MLKFSYDTFHFLLPLTASIYIPYSSAKLFKRGFSAPILSPFSSFAKSNNIFYYFT